MLCHLAPVPGSTSRCGNEAKGSEHDRGTEEAELCSSPLETMGMKVTPKTRKVQVGDRRACVGFGEGKMGGCRPKSRSLGF